VTSIGMRTDFTVTIKPGAAQQVLQNVPENSLLINTSSTSAIWIGQATNTAPGVGTRIGPLGSVSWTAKKGSQLYASVDTGVLTSVNLTVSPNLTNPDNPIDVAVALAGIGVPSVFLSDVLVNDVLNPPGPIDVHSYASLIITLDNIDGTSPLVGTYSFSDSAGNFVDFGLLTADIVNTGIVPAWSIPVVAQDFTFTPAAGSNLRVTLIGTNRALPKGMLYDFKNPLIVLQGTLAANAASGTTVDLLDALGTDLPISPCTGLNGSVLYQWQSTGGNITGDLSMFWRDENGTERSVIAFQNFSTTIARQQSGHPFGFVKWKFKSNALNGATPLTLQLILIPTEQAI